MDEEIVIYVFAWYQKAEWHKLKEVVEDPSSLDDSYEQWRQNAENSIRDIRANGHSVKKISLNIDGLLDWCSLHDRKPSSDARAEYATFLAQSRDK